jgi:thymidine kinase
MAFKPKIDNRYESDKICTNDGYCIKSIVINKSIDIIDYINKAKKPIEKVFIDEVQFFDEKIVKVVNFLAKEKGIDVILAGLIQDFKGAPFGQMPKLLGISQKIRTLTAICVHEREDGKICGKPAFFTQRLINGKPASYNSPIILVGGIDSYTARCEEHWEVPDRPKTNL